MFYKEERRKEEKNSVTGITFHLSAPCSYITVDKRLLLMVSEKPKNVSELTVSEKFWPHKLPKP